MTMVSPYYLLVLISIFLIISTQSFEFEINLEKSSKLTSNEMLEDIEMPAKSHGNSVRIEENNEMAFPDGFLFGAATAAYQIEGGWNASGKGENIWDRLTHTRPEVVYNSDNGDIACDSYSKYKEDVQILRDIGFDVYRFSISWSRILPNGEITLVNEDGVRYYHNLIDELLANGIQPMVTMYHWDLPQKLQDLGGWVNPLMVDYFEDYARLLFELYGKKVKMWITINEPFEVIRGYFGPKYAPALNLGTPADYLVAHSLIRAHTRAYRLYDKEFRKKQNGKISLSLSSRHYEPKSNSKDDKDAAERAYQFKVGLFAHPIYVNGDYHPLVRKIVDENSQKEGRKRSRLPHFTSEEISQNKGAWDFFAVNHYTTRLVTSGVIANEVGIKNDWHVIEHIDPKWPESGAEWLMVVPWGFRKLLSWIKDNYGNPEIYVTENGYCDRGDLNDQNRIQYYTDYMAEMLKAISIDKCHVIGHTAWSVLDNFEWDDGYRNRFGIVQVDFEDPERKRTPKSSAAFFKKLLKKRTLPCNCSLSV